MSNKIPVGIVGISGNGGGELLRYISQHPNFELVSAYGNGSVDEKVKDLFPALAVQGLVPDLTVEVWDAQSAANKAELLFLSLPTEKSKEVAAQIPENIRVIDLGGDNRFADGWAWSIPEVTGGDLRKVTRIANPGCYPTAIILALAPLMDAGLLPDLIVINANSGLSGMGRGSKESATFSDLNEDAWTYKLFNHPHVPEIRSALKKLVGDLPPKVVFVPQCVPMSRGISAVCVLEGDKEDYNAIAAGYYGDCPFVRVVGQPPHTKWASGTNMAFVSYASSSHEERTIIALSAIDNLGKGAAGQAIQNANLMFGLPEDAGLVVTPTWP